MAKSKNSFMGWLGRQVGYVKRAVKTPVPEVVYRKETVQEAKLEDSPEHRLRRTTVDEVIVEPKKDMGETPMPRRENNGV